MKWIAFYENRSGETQWASIEAGSESEARKLAKAFKRERGFAFRSVAPDIEEESECVDSALQDLAGAVDK